MEQYIEIGKIYNTHGVKGEVKIMPLTDDPVRFKKLKQAYVDINGTLLRLTVQDVKFIKNAVILKFEEIIDMDAAEKLKNQFLLVDRTNAVKLPKGSFFICDILGSTVYEVNGNLLGKLNDVIKTGSNDVYIVKSDSGKDILIPALKTVVKEISVEEKRIVVLLPEGLLDD